MPRKRSLTARSSSGDNRNRAEADIEWQRFPWLFCLVAVLFTARFYLPAESAAQGETLWITLLWLVCGALWLIDAYRMHEPLRRFDWLDAGLLLLVGGHVLSAMAVLLTEGDKRAALNMLWEWIGIGVAGLLIRSAVRERLDRERILSCLLTSAVVLSGLGLWQHYVWYPGLSAQFAELEQLEKSTANTASLSISDQKRLSELQQGLGVSVDGDETSERALRDRILASTEPIGRFALANTFAGLLIVGVLIGVGVLQASFVPTPSVVRFAVASIIVGLIGYCLLLTKSRTAMIGLTCGLLIGVGLLGQSVLSSRWGRRATLGACVATVLMILAAVLTGGLDREVISETPKSLRYRLEYWSATAEVIREHPVLGVGPGNFRQAYLKHKRPESSEEILDPHNFLFDVWANGGLFAAVGILLLLIATARQSAEMTRHVGEFEGADIEVSIFNESVLLGAIGSVAMLLAAMVELFQGTDIRSDWLWLAVGWWATVIVLTVTARFLGRRRIALMALVGLMVHLSGAGGIAMPAILQMLLLLIFVLDAKVRESMNEGKQPGPSAFVRRARWGQLAATGMLGMATVACVTSAVVPVTKAKMAMLEAEAALTLVHNPNVAERACLMAAEADSLSPEPWRELGLVRGLQWRQRPTDASFTSVVAALSEAIERDPMGFGGWRALGDVWWERFERSRVNDAAEQALTAYMAAAERYPHHAGLQADVAKAASAAGQIDLARAAAQRALDQDDLNRKFGHADKILRPDLSNDLRTMVDEAHSRDPE